MDGDNTLWDTNQVFENAQREFLRELERLGQRLSPVDGLAQLRELDQQLIALLGRAEYDFVLLWRALAQQRLIQERGLETLIDTPVSGEETVVSRFMGRLREVPPLLPGALETVARLRAASGPHTRISMGIFSEGKPSRLQKTFDTHRDLTALMDFTVVGPKTPENYRAVAEKQGVLASQAHMVGDSLKKDILAAQTAGYRTVWVPSRYTEQHLGLNAVIVPTHVVERLDEIEAILRPLMLSA